MTAQTLVYVLCFVTSIVCAGLLGRSYLRTRRRFLFWCAACFALLAVNNTLVLFDIVLLSETSLIAYRQAAALGAVFVLIFGFMWELD